MNGLDRITEKILAEARDEADRILTAAKKEAEEIRAESAARADAIRVSLSDAAQQEGNHMIARAKADAANRKRELLLAERRRMVDDTFESAMGTIRKMEKNQYIDLLAGLLAAALLEQAQTEATVREVYGEEILTPDGYEVLLNAKERAEIGTELIERTKTKLGKQADTFGHLVLSETVVPVDGGFLLRIGDVEVNCSWKAIFARLREELEVEVSRALFYYEKQT